MELEQLIAKAGQPHLIASAKEANILLAELNSVVTGMRLEVNELELKSNLHNNEITQFGQGTIAQKEAQFKVSQPYIEFRKRKGQLIDLRAIRRNLQRHADILYEQEKYGQKFSGYSRAI